MLIQKALQIIKNRSSKAQSFVELALVLPILLLILLGLVEIVFFIARYLDVMDLTREAARVASIRDPQIGDTYVNGAYQCNALPYNFYYTTACVFAPTEGACTDARFCGGLNPIVYLDPAIDDVVIEVFTVNGNTHVTEVNPTPNGYWAYSEHDSDTVHNSNWKKDCQGNVVISAPQYTASSVAAELVSTSPRNKGFVGVEFFYCYHQVLNLPIANWVIPNPLRIHAYTFMPLPAAQPTPTP
jgi:hypothetical protein